MLRFLSLLLLSTLLVGSTPAPSVAAPLDNEVVRITETGRSGQALWGVYAVDLKTGRELVSVNHDKLFVPASNRKLVTTALATRAFKPTDRLSTLVSARSIDGAGVAQGVVLHAAGDPSWSPELQSGRSGQAMFSRLARQAAEAGLKQIQGDLVVDVSLFDDPAPVPPGWPWDEFENSYAPRPSVLAMNQNLAGVAIRPGNQGQPPIVSVNSPGEPFELVNRANTARAGSTPTLRVRRSIGGDRVEIEGNLPTDAQPGTRAIPVGNPVEMAAHAFTEALKREGVIFNGNIVIEGRRQETGRVLASLEGAPFEEMVRLCNTESDNFLAESLYLLAASRRFARTGYGAGHENEASLWKALQVNESEVLPTDGSGLSRENLITPRALVALLRERSETDWFVSSLPISGRTGTLRYRLSEGGLAGRVQAKTGTLDGVSSLSGYVRTSSGRVVVFSIMANHFTCSNATIRRSIDDIVELLARQ